MTKQNQFIDEDVIKTSELSILNNEEVKIVRTFNAPKELLFKAFTNSSYLEKWWGTYYCEKSVCTLDPKVGGSISIHMTMTGGMEVKLKGEFRELIEHERIVFTTGTFDDETGEFDVLNVNTVVLEEQNGKTTLKLSVKMVKVPVERAKAAFQGMVRAWPESVKRLEEWLKSIKY